MGLDSDIGCLACRRGRIGKRRDPLRGARPRALNAGCLGSPGDWRLYQRRGDPVPPEMHYRVTN
jgi:hypothetical protein